MSKQLRIEFADLDVSSEEISRELSGRTSGNVADIQFRPATAAQGQALADPITIAIIAAAGTALAPVVKASAEYLFDKLKGKRSAAPKAVTVVFRGPKGSLREDIVLENGQVVVPGAIVDRVAAQCGEIAEISLREKPE